MILVTGGSGFIGGHLLQSLVDSGALVRALHATRTPPPHLASHKQIEWLQTDLTDVEAVAQAMQGITYVYHCAAKVGFHKSDEDALLKINVEGTANIVNEAIEQGVKKLLYISSIAALGNGEKNNEPVNEDTPWGESKYQSVYGLSKYLGEMEVWRGIAEGLNAVIVNPGVVLGSANDYTSSAGLIKIAYKQFPFYTEGITAWVGVQDVVNAMMLLMDSNITAERFIVSAGNYGFKHIMGLMAIAMNKKPPHIRAGKLLTRIVGTIGEWKGNSNKTQLINRQTARQAQNVCYYNNEKLLAHLPNFNYTPIETVIKTMANSYLTHISNKKV
ncbi:MAG: NAD-dependent epimerase/dehydratase family protein [Chitinophagia bacterium]|nr:NAD-dependent epimerase/dehydratase family protein [Chitinophagia bacterium]